MSEPGLSVVMCSLGRDSVTRALTSVRASLDAAGEPGAEIVLVWQGAAPPPPVPPGTCVLPLLPIGTSHARNAGAAAATGRWLAFVDDDEVAADSWAAGVLGGAAEGADAVFGPVEPLDDEGRAHCRLTGARARWIDARQTPWSAGTGGNMAFAREALESIGGFHPRLGAGSFGRAATDTEAIARLQRAGARLRWRPDMRVGHPTLTDAAVLATRFPYGFGAGRMVRQLPSARLATRYGLEVGLAALGALHARDRRTGREVAATASGFAAGALARDRWRAPERLLGRLPDELRELIGDRPVRGLPVPHGPVPHFLFALGEDLVLHVYGDSDPRRPAALRAREWLESTGRPEGIPAVRAAVETPGALWLLEDGMPGRPARPGARPAWWPAAAALLVELGRRPGAALRECDWWREASAAALGGRWEAPVGDALAQLGERLSVMTHGDVQPKNVLVAGGRVALVDWEGAAVGRLPGFDLLYLATGARRGRPDPEPLLALARGRDAPGTPLVAALAAVGLDGAAARAAGLVAAAIWADQEGRRAAPLGRRHAPSTAFAELLDAVAPALAHGYDSAAISS